MSERAFLNQSLRLLITHEAPAVFDNCHHFPTFYASKVCPFPGWALEITSMIADYLNITVDPIVGQTSDYGGGVGNIVNGSWQGLLGAVYNESVDVVASMYQYTKDRYRDFDFSYPVYNVKVVYITRTKHRTVASYLWNMFEPYTTATWIALAVSLVLQIVYGTLVRRFEYHMGWIKEFRVMEKLGQYCRIQINQGNEKEPFISLSGFIAFGVFALLQATMFSYLYQASLLASLLQPADLAPFHSAEELVSLVRNGRYKLLATKDNYKSSWYFTDLSQSNEEHFRTLREALVHNPIVLADSIASALDMISNGDYIYPAQQDSYSLITMRQKCNLITFESDQDLPEKSAYYIFRKNSSLINRWNYGILMNQAFIGRTFKKYFEENFLLGSVAQCPITKDDIPESKKPLDLISVFGIFLVFIIGITLAVISFFAELYLFRRAHAFWVKSQSSVFTTVQNIGRYLIRNSNKSSKLKTSDRYIQTWPFNRSTVLPRSKTAPPGLSSSPPLSIINNFRNQF